MTAEVLRFLVGLACLTSLTFARPALATDAAPAETGTLPKDPGAAETQVFWQQRNRDHLILQQLTINNQMDAYKKLETENPSDLRRKLGVFCSSSENTSDCFDRYKRATARQLEDIKGSILRSEDEITRLRNDVPGQGGSVLVRGGAIEAGNGVNEEVKSDQRSFTPMTSGPADLNAPAYVPTLAELEKMGKAATEKNSRSDVYKSNEQKYIEWSRRTFTLQDSNAEQNLNEDYALFQAVKPANGTASGAPLNQVVRSPGGNSGAGTLQVDETKKTQALKSIQTHQGSDLQRANEAKQAAIKAMELEEARSLDPKRTLEQKYSKEEIDAYNQARAMIINAYNSEIAKNPIPKPSSKPASGTGKSAGPAKSGTQSDPEADSTLEAGNKKNTRSPAQSGTSPGSTQKPGNIQARVDGTGLPSSQPSPTSTCQPPYCNDKPVEGQLPSEGDFHIYTNPNDIDADVIDLRE